MRHAVNRTPSALPIRSGQRVCKIDSKSSHSSVEGKVLMKIFVNMAAHFLVERTLDRFKIALEIWLSKKIFISSVKTEIFVEAFLAFINHGDLITTEVLTSECVMKMGLAGRVPYPLRRGPPRKVKFNCST